MKPSEVLVKVPQDEIILWSFANFRGKMCPLAHIASKYGWEAERDQHNYLMESPIDFLERNDIIESRELMENIVLRVDSRCTSPLGAKRVTLKMLRQHGL